MSDYVNDSVTFKGSHALGDEVAYLATKNGLTANRISSRNIFGPKEHSFHVFGNKSDVDRFKAEVEQAKRRIK